MTLTSAQLPRLERAIKTLEFFSESLSHTAPEDAADCDIAVAALRADAADILVRMTTRPDRDALARQVWAGYEHLLTESP